MGLEIHLNLFQLIVTILHLSFSLYYYYFLFFCLFRAISEAYGGSQVRGRIRVTAAGLPHNHSNIGSELRLRSIPQLTETQDP